MSWDLTPDFKNPMKQGDIGVKTFDHPALFNAVKARDIELLHKVLGPTLDAFGSYQVKYLEHARDGILTSLNAFPGTQGYYCMRWAERILNDSHQNSENREPHSSPAEYVYKLRADLLGKAMERIFDFKPLERSGIWTSTAEAIAALDEELTEENLTENEWLSDIQRQVKERDLTLIS